jgi:hypothetical protein
LAGTASIVQLVRQYPKFVSFRGVLIAVLRPENLCFEAMFVDDMVTQAGKSPKFIVACDLVIAHIFPHGVAHTIVICSPAPKGVVGKLDVRLDSVIEFGLGLFSQGFVGLGASRKQRETTAVFAAAVCGFLPGSFLGNLATSHL